MAAAENDKRPSGSNGGGGATTHGTFDTAPDGLRRSTVAKSSSARSFTPDTPLLAPTDAHDVGVRLSSEEALAHLIKGLTGTGLLSLPLAFSQCGLWLGLIMLLVVCAIDTYCMRMLARSADYFRRTQKRRALDYANLCRLALEHGVPSLRRWGYACKFAVNALIMVTSFGTCGIYFVFLAENTKQVLDSVTGGTTSTITTVQWIAIWLLPVLLLCLVRQLKHLAIPCMVADIIYVVACVATFQYLLYDLPDSRRLPRWPTEGGKVPMAMGTIMFAFEGVCLVLPIANQVDDKPFFTAWNGVLHTGCAVVTVIYSCVGFFGYVKFGDRVRETVTLNLPQTGPYPYVRVLFCLAIFVTFALQFYVPLERIDKFVSRKVCVGRPRVQQIIYYAARILLVLMCFSMAELVPHLSLIISLIGACGSSSLAVLLPAIIDILVHRAANNGQISLRNLEKNLLIVAVALVAIVMGTYSSLVAIINTF